MAAVRRLAVELAPLWWVARGYALVVVYAQLTDAGWIEGLPVIPHFSTGAFSAIVLTLAISVSVALGLRARRSGTVATRLAVAANVALGVATLSAGAHALDAARGSYLSPTEHVAYYEETPRTAFNDAARRVANPEAGPKVKPPRVVTSRLKRRR